MKSEHEAKRRGSIRKFLKCDLNSVRVVEVTDGEITLEFDGDGVTLYLNHILNEDQGFPESFTIKRK